MVVVVVVEIEHYCKLSKTKIAKRQINKNNQMKMKKKEAMKRFKKISTKTITC